MGKSLGVDLLEFTKDYPVMMRDNLIEKYHLTTGQIKSLAGRLGLRKTPEIYKKCTATGERKLSKDIVAKIKEEYPKKPTRKIAEELGLSNDYIRSIASRVGVYKTYETRYQIRPSWFAEKTVISPPPDELSYLAGFVDGEGSFNISKVRNKKTGKAIHNAHFYISNTNEEIIKWIKSKLGGAILGSWRGSHCKTIYRLTLASMPRLKCFCELLIPHLKVKKEPAKLMLRWCKLRLKGRHRYTGEEKRLYRELKILNKRGSDE